tara:strand:+ start:689 stop:1816 length:1128 start_codon:yes stop_codon:yes gene_type:complete
MNRIAFNIPLDRLLFLLVTFFISQGDLVSSEPGSLPSLISSAQKAVGQLVNAAQADPALLPDSSKAKPFWEAMKVLNESLGRTQTGMMLKDETFFSNMASSSAMLAQAQVAVGMSGSADPKVAKGLKLLTILIRKMDENFCKESARLKQGGVLSSEEKRQLENLKRQVANLETKLTTVERSTAGSNPNIQRGIRNIRSHTTTVIRADNSVAGFVGGMVAGRLISEWVWGWHWWWGPWGGWCPGWVDINIGIWDDWVEAVPYDWDYYDSYLVDVAELELDQLIIDEVELDMVDTYLEDAEFNLIDGDLEAITADLELGWDDVASDLGHEIQAEIESNFDEVPYEPSFEPNTFDDYGIDDFGGGYDDFGGGLDFDFW